MNNAKLSVQEMKEMIELFVRHKLHALKIGDFELQKNHYEVEVSENNIASIQEDPLFLSAPQYPPEVQDYLSSVMDQQKKQWKK